jgi:hypothetical protein
VLIVATLAVVVVAVVMAVLIMGRRLRVVPAGRVIAGIPVGGLDERKVRTAIESRVRGGSRGW